MGGEAMKLPFEEYTPKNSPEEVLLKLEKRARRRRVTFSSITAVILLFTGIFIFSKLRPDRIERTVALNNPVVKKVWHDGRDTPYTLLQLKKGGTVIIISKPTEER
jgi:hypothetical protein